MMKAAFAIKAIDPLGCSEALYGRFYSVLTTGPLHLAIISELPTPNWTEKVISTRGHRSRHMHID